MLNQLSALGTADYLTAVLNLLPRGRAWLRDLGGVPAAFFGGLADMAAMFHAAASSLVDLELTPSTADALIDLWEDEYGLPDPCAPAAQTLQRRRQAVVARKVDPGGLSRQRYIDLAAQFGVTATIDEWINPYTGASDPTQVFVWRLNTHETAAVAEMRVGAHCGDRLRSWGDAELECAIRQRNRAGRIVLFAYL